MKPSIPQGTRDFSPEVVRKRQYILNTIKTVFETFCFQPLETPAMENLSTLTGKYGDEGDKLMFKILNNGLNNPDKRDKTVAAFNNVLNGKNDLAITERALRYDLTIPFARFVAMNSNDLAFPFKRYQMQPVWRADRPQKGRYREFWQCDADVVGSNSLLNEAELLAIYRQAFHNLQVPGIEIRINSRKILAGLAETCSASEQLIDLTVAIDKLDKIGIEGVTKELTEKGFTSQQIEFIERYLSIPKGEPEEMLEQLNAIIGNSTLAQAGIQEIKETLAYHKLLLQQDWNNELVLDFKLARGLNYYTGIIVEVVTTAVEMGSIGGGGRYDDLTGLFGLKGMSGVGVSFGIDRIFDVMDQLTLFPASANSSTKVLFLNIEEHAISQIIKYTSVLRKQGIAAESYPDYSKMDKQMKYANKRNLPFVAIVGSKELEQHTITLKNMITGEQNSLSFEEMINILK